MKQRNSKMVLLSVLTLTASLLVSPQAAQAYVTLSDGNSVALVDVNSSAGMFQWNVDGVNHLNQQWFWYRADSGAQAPINAIGAANWSQANSRSLLTSYANANYGVEIKYTLTGGGAGSSDIAEDIKISNTSGSLLNFTFYQYSDFNLLNTPGGDSVQMDNSSSYQWKGATQIAEGIVIPDATAHEANFTGGTTSTLYRLANTPNLTLNNTGQVLNGDVTWTFQWDLAIPAGQEAIITKDKQLSISIIPEPSVLALGSLGFAALLLRRRARA
jgi:hypothetical protein